MPRRSLIIAASALSAGVFCIAGFRFFTRSSTKLEVDLAPLRSSLEQTAEAALPAPAVTTATLRLTPPAAKAPSEIERVLALAEALEGTVLRTDDAAETRLLVQIPALSVAGFCKKVSGSDAAVTPASNADELQWVEVTVAHGAR